MPAVGDLGVVHNGSGTPPCVIETVAVDDVPFDEVDEAFARAEGEGFESVADWRETHWAPYRRTLADLDLEPTQEMPVVCERFRVVYPELSARVPPRWDGSTSRRPAPWNAGKPSAHILSPVPARYIKPRRDETVTKRM